MNHYGYQRGMLKETKGITLTSFTWFIATVPNNVFQARLGLFSNTFRQASDRPTVKRVGVLSEYGKKRKIIW